MNLKNKKILITGAAGFIGAALVERLLQDEAQIIGIDNFNDYYNPLLKQKRVENIERKNKNKCFKIYNVNLKDTDYINQIFEKHNPNIVINLAAQAGVRYSLENPITYMESNIFGFLNILEGCRNHEVEHLIYASSSSVYGGNKIMPFNEDHNVDHPLSLYAATPPIDPLRLIIHLAASNEGYKLMTSEISRISLSLLFLFCFSFLLKRIF